MQTDSLLPDLRHEPEATPADNATIHSCGAVVAIRGLPELFEVHGHMRVGLCRLLVFEVLLQ